MGDSRTGNGTAWSITVIPQLDSSFTAITSIWGTASNNIYAVTDALDPFEPSDAYVLHYDGSTWSIVQTIHKGTDWGRRSARRRRHRPE